MDAWARTLEVILFDQPALMETFLDILLCVVPIWLAVMIGLVIGWSWRLRWTGIVFLGLRSKLRFAWTLPPGLGARRVWLAFTALSAFSVGHRFLFSSRGLYRFKRFARAAAYGSGEAASSAIAGAEEDDGDAMRPATRISEVEKNVVTETDLKHLKHIVNGNDGEMAWQSMMERSTSNLTYQAWRHEPESGPIIYRSKTIFEDATADIVRDFFWDDEFRPKWDPMLAHFKILEECPLYGTMIIHWIKKFPFFCSDREYIIGRRIWEAGRTFYCLTKGVPYPALPRLDKPRRVDHYFSSWIIRPVQSLKGDGPACEVMLIHYEDMGIPKDVAKLGVRHGMWGTVKKLHNGFRAYQNMRKTPEASLSRCAIMARITTKLPSDEGEIDSIDPELIEEEGAEDLDIKVQNGRCGIDWKWVAIGGAAIVAGLRSGLIGKALLVAAGHRAAKGRK